MIRSFTRTRGHTTLSLSLSHHTESERERKRDAHAFVQTRPEANPAGSMHVSICLYVCMAYVYVCIYVCMHVCMHAVDRYKCCTYMSTEPRKTLSYAYRSVCMHACMHGWMDRRTDGYHVHLFCWLRSSFLLVEYDSEEQQEPWQRHPGYLCICKPLFPFSFCIREVPSHLEPVYPAAPRLQTRSLQIRQCRFRSAGPSSDRTQVRFGVKGCFTLAPPRTRQARLPTMSAEDSSHSDPRGGHKQPKPTKEQRLRALGLLL